MNEKELKLLRNLKEVYKISQLICSPIEYLRRQEDLLQCIAKTLIKPLEDYEDMIDNQLED